MLRQRLLKTATSQAVTSAMQLYFSGGVASEYSEVLATAWGSGFACCGAEMDSEIRHSDEGLRRRNYGSSF